MKSIPPTSPLIKISDLNKTFGQHHVLKGINLEVQAGESLVIIGGSGSGKSVLLKCLLGLITPDSGAKIEIAGLDRMRASKSELEHSNTKISMLFQGSALFDSLPVWENICFRLLQTKQMTRKQAYEKACTLLPAVGLKQSVATLYPAELSGGMQRRVALARAIAPNPEIIFFDEPTTGLDPIMAGVIDDLIIKNVKDLGATAITITHDMASAKRIADRIAMLYEGQIIWLGSTPELATTDNPYVQQFVAGQTVGPIKVEV
jgi:ABC-type transport system involved in resistance to organic solvents, ATPase component